jgi:hypothetical protein
MTGKSNGKTDFIVTRDEFNDGMQEQVENIIDVMNAINALRRSLNIQAEVLGAHRFILEKFVPKPLLEQAAKDYVDMRQAVIAAEGSDAPKVN